MAYDAARSVVVLFGGGNGYLISAETWEYDGTAWTPGPTAPPGMASRYGHVLAFDGARARMVLFGGYDGSNYLGDVWERAGGNWIPGASSPPGPSARSFPAMTFDGSRSRVVLFGGYAGGAARKDTWEYDGAGWTLGPVAPQVPARYRSGMAFDATRARCVLFGGYDGVTYLGDTWEYDGASWTPGAAAPAAMTPRAAFAVAYDARRSLVLLFGGWSPGSGGTYHDDLWEYDGASWQPGSAAPGGLTGRVGHGMAFDGGRDRTVIFGGYDSAGRFRNDTWEHDGAAWLPSPASPPPGLTPRSGAAGVYDTARSRVVVFGGHAGYSTDEIWEYDGASWTAAPPPPAALAPRWGHAMAYDSDLSRTVVAGGQGLTLLNDTWFFDGAQWTPGPSFPTRRWGLAMAYDASRRRTVMFGGRESQNNLRDTFELAGGTWSQGPFGPPARHLHAMAFDQTRQVVVLFGGAMSNLIDLGDTWEYDGAWLRGPPAPAALTPRRGHGMAYDESLHRVILFGGNLGAGWPTFEYDGAAWTPGGSPPAVLVGRHPGAVVYDRSRSRIVIFGGAYPEYSRKFNDTWEYVPSSTHYLVGAGLGDPNPNRVRVLDSGGSPTPTDFMAYGAGHWGVNVAAGAIETAPTDAIVTGPGPGAVYGPTVRGFRAGGGAIAKVAFFAYGTLKYGVNVGVGRIDADAFDEMLSGAGPGEVFGPHVRGWNFDGLSVSAVTGMSYFAYATLKWGVNVAGAGVDGDGFSEILTAPGPGPTFAPLVRGWSYDGGPLQSIAKIGFWAFPDLEYGAVVAGGDADADGFDEILCAPGPGASRAARFRGFDFDGAAIAPAPGFDAVLFPSVYGGRVGSGSMDGLPREELLATAGRDPTADSTIRPHIYSGSSLIPHPVSFLAMPGTAFGVNATSGAYGF